MKLEMRNVHRWVGLIAALFLLVIAASGLALQVHLIAEPPPSLAPAKSETPVALPPGFTDEQIQTMLSVVLEAAQRTQPGAPVIAVRLRKMDNVPIGDVTVAAPEPLQMAFDARTGDPVRTRPQLSRVHDVLLQIHRGDLIGQTGVWLSIASGLILTALAVTGTVVYLNMYRTRVRLKKRPLFWK